MRVAVGISSPEQPRWGIFFDSLMHVKGVTTTNVLYKRGANIALNRNDIAERAIQEGYHAVWYVDDDQVFAPSTLEHLLAADKDIISGLYLKREMPFIPHQYEQHATTRMIRPRLLRESPGLNEVEVTGAGCLLVKCSVFEKMGKPWWRLGEVDKVNWHDDAGFCLRARQAGFSVWCDERITVGHCMTGQVWPHYDAEEKRWYTIFLQGNQAIASWPAAQEKPE